MGKGVDCEQSLFFLLSSSSRGKTSRKPARGILGKEKQEKRFPRAGFRDVFPRLDELKRKNRDCSQSRKGVMEFKSTKKNFLASTCFVQYSRITE